MLRVNLGRMPSLPRAQSCPSPPRVLALALGRNPQKRPHHAQPCGDQRPVFDFPTLETHRNCPAAFVAARHGAPLRTHPAHTRGATYTAARPRTRVGTGDSPRAPFPPPLELCRAAGHPPRARPAPRPPSEGCAGFAPPAARARSPPRVQAGGAAVPRGGAPPSPGHGNRPRGGDDAESRGEARRGRAPLAPPFPPPHSPSRRIGEGGAEAAPLGTRGDPSGLCPSFVRGVIRIIYFSVFAN